MLDSQHEHRLGLLGRHGMLLLEKPPIVLSEESRLRDVVEQSVGDPSAVSLIGFGSLDSQRQRLP